MKKRIPKDISPARAQRILLDLVQTLIDIDAFMEPTGEQFTQLERNLLTELSEEVAICKCGSGKTPEWVNDAQNIPLCEVCSDCRANKLARYRPEILTGYTQADVNESIEPE